MKKLIYPAVLYPYTDESGGYVIEVPDLPGCVSGGEDMAEAILMGGDAACGWILDELECGNTLPSPTDYHEVEVREGGMVNLLVLDMESYAEKYGSKSVRKNLTIPAWLNTFAEVHNINFSRILQDALLQMAQTESKDVPSKGLRT